MSHIIISVLAFLAAIGILVPFHEWGHFWVARRFGVKVQRFAIGFGKVLWSRRARDGVEYCVCAIPLGGYVKMLDEREGDVAPADLPYAFNRQKVWKRFLIVLAGPAFNLLLAFLLCIAVFKLGFDGPIPWLAEPPAHSVAAENGLKAGDELLAIEGKATPTIENAFHVWKHHLDEPVVTLSLLREGETLAVRFKQPEMSPSSQIDFLELMGVDFILPAKLGEIAPDSPAMKGGLRENDVVLRVNNAAVSQWDDVVSIVSKFPHQKITLDVMRDGERQTFVVTPDARPDGTGMIGAHIPTSFFRAGPLDWQDSVAEAFQQTYKMMTLNVKLLAQMATGGASFDNISGPVTIARVAGTSAEQGVVPYLYFLALISVGLAVLNLLPIPMLDGGHLLFYVVEMVTGRPLSERAQTIAFVAGLAILISLMLIALYNDMMHWA